MNSKQIIGHIMSVTGESISALAARNGYTKQAFYDVIKGRTKTKRLQELISAITGLPIDLLWPGEPANKMAEAGAVMKDVPTATSLRPVQAAAAASAGQPPAAVRACQDEFSSRMPV